jgi:hypothetical protein
VFGKTSECIFPTVPILGFTTGRSVLSGVNGGLGCADILVSALKQSRVSIVHVEWVICKPSLQPE